ncbi:hypothetical protein ABZU53_11225 [Micromonospora sp. NPDC005194]|uniref:hypothetical protein n=1 Tax=Micromonospora sp. NPDC005194 TaxID=3156870 RepID=UPI0033B8AC4E
MTDDVGRDPLARAVFAELARSRGPNDPLGSLARTVLDGAADLQTAAAVSWHGAALDAAFAEALTHRDGLSVDQLAEFEQQALQLRNAADQGALHVEVETNDCHGTEGDQQR